MSRSKAVYIIEVSYPETEEKMLELRRKMGNYYMEFVENYIITLPISDDEKNKLYSEINNKLIGNYTASQKNMDGRV